MAVSPLVLRRALEATDSEKTYDADVQVVCLTSDDGMRSKLKGSDGADFDVFSVATSALGKLIEAGLVKPIDVTKISNLANQLPQFQDLSQVAGVPRDGTVYSLPMAYGSIGLLPDVDRVSPAPTSWSVLWDPQSVGQVRLSDTSEVNVTMMAVALGMPNPFKLSPEQLEPVKPRFLEHRPGVISSTAFDYSDRFKWSGTAEDLTARNDLWNAVKAAQ